MNRVTRSCTRVAVATLALTLTTTLAASLPSFASATRPSATAVPARCTTSQLVAWLDTMGSGTAGGSYYDVEVTNLSSHACSLDGYPGVVAVNLAGHQLGRAASDNPAHAPVTVTLASGASAAGLPPIDGKATATFVMKITDTGVYSSTSCDPTTAAGFRITPPGQMASLTVPFPFVACGKTTPVFLQVEALQAAILPG